MKVATIEKILEIKPHTGADNLELAKIKGWQVCVKKGEYNPGDLCVYICVDSVVEDKPQYEFLKNKNFRIKTIKLRGELSQGIVFPLSILKEFGHSLIVLDENIEGTDVSKYVFASHYEKPIPQNLAGKIKGMFPTFLVRTDEDNIKNNPAIIDELKGKNYYISTKIDGSSGTFYLKDNQFGVCSRNLELIREDSNIFWKMAIKYDLENKLKTYFMGKNVCVQGEVYGPGIQKNLLGESEVSLKLFNLFDIDEHKYLGFKELSSFCRESSVPMIHIVEVGFNFDKTLKELQILANELKYDNGNLAEGLVIRPQEECYSNTLRGRLSGKVVSEPFELKFG